jgi:hypothetical protein
MKDLTLQQQQELLINLNKGVIGTRTDGKWNTKFTNEAKTGFLKYNPEKIYKLAEPFTNAQQMKNFKGENQEQIRQAGAYIMFGKVERPEWFERIIWGKQESKEECIQILNDSCTTSEEIYADKNLLRLLQRLWTIHKVSPQDVRKLTPNITWGFTDWTDDDILSCLNLYKNTREVRQAKTHKTLLTKLQVDKGNEYPKSYAKYLTMKIPSSQIKRSKRGGYKQRNPRIEQYSLEGVYIKTFDTWKDVEEAGFKRATVTGAIRGTNGQKTAKGFIWKFENTSK